MPASKRDRVRHALDQLGGRATSRQIARVADLTSHEVQALSRRMPDVTRVGHVTDPHGDTYLLWGLCRILVPATCRS